MAKKIKIMSREIELKSLLVVLALLAVFAFLIKISDFSGKGITGFVTVEQQKNYSETIGLEFSESRAYTWNLENPGQLKSIKINGRKYEHGAARVYVENNNIRYLIFDSEQLVEKPSGVFGITGLAVFDENETQSETQPDAQTEIRTEINGTLNEEQQNIINLLIDDINNTRNDLEIGVETKSNKGKGKGQGNNEVKRKIKGDITVSQYELVSDLAISLENAAEDISIFIESRFEQAPEPEPEEIPEQGSGEEPEQESDETPEETEQETEEANETNSAPIWNSEIESFALNSALAIDLSDYYYDADSQSLTYTAGAVENVSISISNSIIELIPDNNIDETKQIEISAFDGQASASQVISLIINTTEEIPFEEAQLNETATNKTEINQSDELNKTKEISINLEYKPGTEWDIDNNGIENINGIIDFTVENSGFNWDVNSSKLCARWEIYSEESLESTFVCYGGQQCCNFIGLQPTLDSWDSSFEMYSGRFYNSKNYTIGAQLIYVDIDLEKLESDIIYSGLASLPAVFEEYSSISFEDVCIDTCWLNGFNKTSYRLIVEIENTTLWIDEIKYTIEPAQEIPVNITNETANITENLICKEFQDDVLWTSNYSVLPEGSTSYHSWNISTNCAEAGGYNCFLQNITVNTRSLYASAFDINKIGDGYIQISEPDESICDAPEQGVYSRYLSYEKLTDEGKVIGWYCGKNKNANAKCALEIANKHNYNATCYGIKAHGSQYFLVDTFKVKYTWCWDKSYGDSSEKNNKKRETGLND